MLKLFRYQFLAQTSLLYGCYNIEFHQINYPCWKIYILLLKIHKVKKNAKKISKKNCHGEKFL